MTDRTDVYNKKNINNTKIKRADNIKFYLKAFFMIVFFITLFFIICGMFFFKVKNIKITGNIYYDAEEITEKSGIERGAAIFTVNKSEAAQKIKENFPYITSVKIKITFPNSVKIEVENDTGAYKIKLGGEYYIISKDFKVLCREEVFKRKSNPDGEEYEDHIINIKTNDAVNCFVGSEIMFSDQDVKDILKIFYEAFTRNEIFDYITELDISDKFNITAVYGGRFRIEYGNFEYVEIKTQFAYNIIQTIDSEKTGIIDVKDKKEGVFIEQRIY